MNTLLKALAEENRLKIVHLLLQHNYCVRALSRKLEISEAAISQHIKVLREAGLLIANKKGYFMHYDVNRDVLRDLSAQFLMLADIECKPCMPQQEHCHSAENVKCHHRQQQKPCQEKDKKHNCKCHQHTEKGDNQ